MLNLTQKLVPSVGQVNFLAVEMNSMKRRKFLGLCAGASGAAMLANGPSACRHVQGAQASTPKRFVSGREDGRFIDTAGFVHVYMKEHKPKLAFDPDMDPREFPKWQEQLRQKVRELMAFPTVAPQPVSRQIHV